MLNDGYNDVFSGPNEGHFHNPKICNQLWAVDQIVAQAAGKRSTVRDHPIPHPLPLRTNACQQIMPARTEGQQAHPAGDQKNSGRQVR